MKPQEKQIKELIEEGLKFRKRKPHSKLDDKIEVLVRVTEINSKIDGLKQGYKNAMDEVVEKIEKRLNRFKEEKKEYVTDHGHNWVISVLEDLIKQIKGGE